MTFYPIDHNVPIPAAWAERVAPQWSRADYQWGRFDVGDSILVPCVDHDDQVACRMRLLASASRYGKRWGWKFTTRLWESPRGVRIWRVA